MDKWSSEKSIECVIVRTENSLNESTIEQFAETLTNAKYEIITRLPDFYIILFQKLCPFENGHLNLHTST